MSRESTINEGLALINEKNNIINPSLNSKVENTTRKVKSLLQEGHIDDMTAKWPSLTPNPPHIPIFYTLTKIHRLTPVGRPIISGCDGPMERVSTFVDWPIQPIVEKQDSSLKDTIDFLNFIESTKLPENTVLVFVDVTSLYTNIPHKEGVTIVCHAYKDFCGEKAPIPTKYLREMLYLILTENSFFGSNYLKTCGCCFCKHLHGQNRKSNIDTELFYNNNNFICTPHWILYIYIYI